MNKAAPVKYAPHFTGQAQGFSPEAYYMYVEGGNPRRTPIIGKIAIYGWKPPISSPFDKNALCVCRSIPCFVLGYILSDLLLIYPAFYIYTRALFTS
jgi:hypothetical protein